MPPAIRLSGIVLDCPDHERLAAFYSELLGWRVQEYNEGWIVLSNPASGVLLSFARSTDYEPPTWPHRPGRQRTMLHLDLDVADLDASCRHALALGARRASFQPQQDVIVMLDPAGHPFCLSAQQPSRPGPD